MLLTALSTAQLSIADSRWMKYDWHWQSQKKKTKYLSPCHFVQYKSYMDWPSIEPKPLRWQAMNLLPEPLHGKNFSTNHICISFCMLFKVTSPYLFCSTGQNCCLKLLLTWSWNVSCRRNFIGSRCEWNWSITVNGFRSRCSETKMKGWVTVDLYIPAIKSQCSCWRPELLFVFKCTRAEQRFHCLPRTGKSERSVWPI